MSATEHKFHCFAIRLRWLILPVLVCGLGRVAGAGQISDVSVVNVTPTSFGVVWRSTNATPGIEVFADSGGVTNLAGQVGIEAYPLRTGNPDLAAGYERRMNAAGLRQKTSNLGLMFMKVSGCKPGTAYYYRLKATPPTGGSDVYPSSGPLPEVVTATENSFVTNAQMIILNVPGVDSQGAVVLLSHTNAAYALAAVVGDGVGLNQVFFNVNDLFDLTRTGDFTPMGDQTFNLQVLGANQTGQTQNFTLTFTANFSTALTSVISVNTDFLAMQVGKTVLRAGDAGQVPVIGDANTNLTAIDLALNIPSGRLTNLVVQSLAPFLDSGASSIVTQDSSHWLLHLAAQSGQAIRGSNLLAQIHFTAVSNQSSAFVPLQVTSVSGTREDTLPVSQVFAQSGRVVVIANQPLLEAGFAGNGSRQLTLYGKAWMSYQIECSTNLSDPQAWTPVRHFAQTNMVSTVGGLGAPTPRAFYRAAEYMPDPPALDALLESRNQRTLLGYGQPGKNYTVLAKTNLSNVIPWTPVTTYTLTNSFHYLPAPGGGNVIFYRLQRN